MCIVVHGNVQIRQIWMWPCWAKTTLVCVWEDSDLKAVKRYVCGVGMNVQVLTMFRQSCPESYLCPVVLECFLQFHLGSSRLLLVGLSQVFNGWCMDMVQLRAQRGCREQEDNRIKLFPICAEQIKYEEKRLVCTFQLWESFFFFLKPYSACDKVLIRWKGIFITRQINDIFFNFAHKAECLVAFNEMAFNPVTV